MIDPMLPAPGGAPESPAAALGTARGASHRHDRSTLSRLKTPDLRYLVLHGRLWRATNPHLASEARERLVAELVAQRAALNRARRDHDSAESSHVRRRLEAIRVALGERGAPWWTDGAADYDRRLIRDTPYADWFAGLRRRGRRDR